MKAAAVVLLVLTACATPPAPSPVGVQITVTQARADACKAAGGCGLLSAAEVTELQRSAYQLGAKTATQAIENVLDSNGCRRDKT
jgi:hypothetical protein